LGLASKFSAKLANKGVNDNGNQKHLMKSVFSLKQGIAYDLAREWKQGAGFSDNEKTVLMQLANSMDAELNAMAGLDEDSTTSVWHTVQQQFLKHKT